MILFSKTLSDITINGKKEVIISPKTPSPLPEQIHSGIFVFPDLFIREDITVNCKFIFRHTKEELDEARHEKMRLDYFCFKLYNLSRILECCPSPISPNQMQQILVQTEPWGSDSENRWITIEMLKDVIGDFEPAQTRYQNNRMLYDYFLEYYLVRKYKYHNIQMMAILVRKIVRFELYQKIVMKRADYNLSVDTIDHEDFEDLQNYLRNEHKLSLQYPKQMKRIIDQVDNLLPRQLHKKLIPQSESSTIKNMYQISLLFFWLFNDKREIDKNPFGSYEPGDYEWARHPLSLTLKELESIQKHDFSRSPAKTAVQDLFIFQCKTGIRYSDLKYLTADNIHGNTIEYTPKRHFKAIAKAEPIVILDRECLNIIERHKDDYYGNRLFFCYHIPQYEAFLKVIFKECGLSRMVFTHDSIRHKNQLVPLYQCACANIAIETYSIRNGNKESSPTSRLSSRSCDETCKSIIELIE